MLVSVVGHYSIVSLALLSSVDFGTTVPPLTEFIKNLLGKYTEGQILKVSEEQYNYNNLYQWVHYVPKPHNSLLLCKHVIQVLCTSFSFIILCSIGNCPECG